MKTLLFSLIILLATTSIFAQEPLMKVYLQDGSYITYKIADIDDIGIIKSKNPSYFTVHHLDTNFAKYRLKLRTIEIDTFKLDKQNFSLYTPYGNFNFRLADIDSIVIEQRNQNRVEYEDKTKHVDSLAVVSRIDTSAGKIIIEYLGTPPNFEKGDIIVNQKGMGILAKIKEVNTDGNKVIIDTSFATISDAFRELYIDTLINVNPDDVIRLSKIQKAGASKGLLEAVDTTYIVEENGVTYQVHLKYDQPIIKKGIDKIQGNSYPIQFDFPNFSFSYDDFSLEADLITVGKDISLDFEIKKEWWEIIPSYLRLAKIEKEGMEFQNLRIRGNSIMVKTPPLFMIQVPLNPPPLVITTGIEVELGISLSTFIQSGLNSSLQFTTNRKIGFEYSNGSTKPIVMIKGDSKVVDFDRSATGLEIKYFGEINAGIYLYGLIGPSFFMQPYINGIVEFIQPNANKHIYFNYGCSFGGRFGSELLNISFIELTKSFDFLKWDFYYSPEIIDINPKIGKIGDIVTISGNYFAKQGPNNFVSFNSVKATEYEKWTEQEIRLKIPNGATSGPVTVSDAWMKSNSIYISILDEPQPTIISVVPSTAKIGDIITVTGINFGTSRGTSFVSFAENKATEYPSWSDTEIKVKVPEGAKSGKIWVEVNGKKSNESAYKIINEENKEPGISSINPSIAKIGDIITISGMNFGTSRGSSFVSFSGTVANEYKSWNDTEIKVKVPEGAKSGYLWIVVSGRKSNEIMYQILTEELPEPYISNLSSSSFKNGDEITIYGSNFGNNQSYSSVKFENKKATNYISWNNSKIIVQVPEEIAFEGYLWVEVNSKSSNKVNYKIKRDSLFIEVLPQGTINAKLNDKITFKIKIKDKNGYPVSGARVGVEDNYNMLPFKYIEPTDNNGEIEYSFYCKYFRNGWINFQGSKSGYYNSPKISKNIILN